MKRLAIRFALTIYPRKWRQRYGAEVEEISLQAAGPSYGQAAFVILDLITGGIATRINSTSARIALAGSVVLAVVAALVLQASLPTGTADRISLAHSQMSLRLSTILPNGAQVGPFVTIVRTHAAGNPLSVRVPKSHGRGEIVRVDPDTGAVLTMAGSGVAVVMNPNTQQISSLTGAGNTGRLTPAEPPSGTS